MTPHAPLVPRQGRRSGPDDDVEREVARTAELVLQLTALADRYEAARLSRDRVALMRATVLRGQRALADLAAPERLRH
jgi:hypothetical protein